jgi:hypothetical protein
MPAALEALTAQREGQPTFRIGLLGISLGQPSSPIPHYHGSCAIFALGDAIFALGDGALEVEILQRVILVATAKLFRPTTSLGPFGAAQPLRTPPSWSLRS